METKEYVITLLVTVIVSITVGPAIAGAFDTNALGTIAATGYVTFVTTLAGYETLLRPRGRIPDVPDLHSDFIDKLAEAESNFSAVSSKEPALWESPSFMFYLAFNGVKCLVEYSKGFAGPFQGLSGLDDDLKAYYSRALEIAHQIGEGQEPQHFYGLRLLIYPKRMYNPNSDHRKFLYALMQIHALNRIYCIPIVREQMVQLLQGASEDDREHVAELAELLGQRPEETELPSSVMGNIARRLQRLLPDKGSELGIPDFLIVDDRRVWWYKGQELQDSQTFPPKRRLQAHEAAVKCFRVLCKYADDARWSEFNEGDIRLVPVLRAEFFGTETYERWIRHVTDSGSMADRHVEFHDWLGGEEVWLSEVVTEGSNVLDIGCGYGRHVELVLTTCKASHADGVDVSHTMIGKATKRLLDRADDGAFDRAQFDLNYEDASALTYPDNSYDFVICMTNTFGNMNRETQARVLREARRVLKPGGALILSVYKDRPDVRALREESYKHVDLMLKPERDPSVIETVEGLYSEQFGPTKLAELLEGFEDLQWKDVGTIGLGVVARQPDSPVATPQTTSEETDHG